MTFTKQIYPQGSGSKSRISKLLGFLLFFSTGYRNYIPLSFKSQVKKCYDCYQSLLVPLYFEKLLCWVDPGWTRGAHQSRSTLPFLVVQGRGNTMEDLWVKIKTEKKIIHQLLLGKTDLNRGN